MEKKNNLVSGPLVSSLLWFTLPFLLSNILQTLYGTVDTLVIGNFGTTGGLSAVSTGALVLGLVTFLSIGLASGGTVILGQCIGAKDDKQAAVVVGNLIICFAAVSFVLMGIMLCIYPYLLDLMNIPPEALQEGLNYMRICSMGIPLIIGYNIVCAILRAVGDSKSPMLFVFVAALVNVAGDLLLTGALHMGASGVAIATVTAQGVSFVFGLIFTIKRGLPFSFSRKDIRFNGDMTKRIFKIGVPMGVQSVLINLSFMFITAIINSMGVTASAAMGIGDKISGFAFMPQSAFSASIAVIVSQNIGAAQPKRAISAVKVGVLICCAIEVVFCAFCQFCPNLLPHLFTSDEQVIVMAGQYLRAYSIDALLTSLTFCLSGLLNGCGKTTFNMAQNLIATFLGRIPATYLLARLPNVNLFLIGLAAPASTLISVGLLGFYVLTGRWKKGIDLMGKQTEEGI